MRNDVLRSALDSAGVTADQLAENVGVDPKTVGRWLAVGRVPHPRHRVAAARMLGAAVNDLWPDIVRRSAWVQSWTDVERQAASLRGFQVSVVPGLIQTEDYARAILTDAGLHTPENVEQLLATRMARQRVLRRPTPPNLVMVLDEMVLRRPVGGPAVMRDQLHRIVTECEHPYVRVHVVPASVGGYAGLNGPFVIATDKHRGEVGYLDNQLHGQVVSQPEDLAMLSLAWEAIRGEALPHRQSIDLIAEVAKTWT